ncbi:uncharacterized protein NDAI_0A00190 [Naumovozyma dairenensis CBS 421]|uniref:Uncharacterized protein n=1 Tax=Naumovozyma dairenensis (strain ATCC 10597 / BCRC 20456 / CBS 421 / NBRC 0211 / NRRL Y-12639) TaxID=1071378 RepID=G0W5G5_NAUDC|nr:hypothetical protein NDAI_0A00190 [Naumovozyma dairenensis CBS 421]CCD22179.1 hypothetical protein NDAI_0A00190 [Naumovozyma dairenensis CBS 421]
MRRTMEDSIIGGLEYICNIFDNVYLLKSLGIISENNLLYRNLNKGNFGSKIWFVTLILTTRKLVHQLIRAVKARIRLVKERKNSKRITRNENLVSSVLHEKLDIGIKKCSSMIMDLLLELFQTLVYLFLVSINIFKLKFSDKMVYVLEHLSNLLVLIRMFSAKSNGEVLAI